MSPRLQRLFEEVHRELRPRTPLPEFRVEFYRFANLNNTVRLREGRVRVRISDLLEGAPASVLRSVLHILLARLYREPVERQHLTRYRRFISSRGVTERAHLVRQMRGRKHLRTAQGSVYDLEQVFEELNRKHFHGLLGRPLLTWSRDHARNSLGHYDPAHNTIVISRVFDSPRTPRYALEYLLYHEMLHLKHPVKLRGGRRCVHSAAFQAEEKLFPHLEQAKRFLKSL